MSKPPRIRFQFHLSTAVLMMLSAGGLIQASLPIRYIDMLPNSAPELDRFYPSNSYSGVRGQCFGWPCTAMYSVVCTRLEQERDFTFYSPPLMYWRARETLIDLEVALAGFLGIAIVCEWRIRRASI